MRLCRPGRLPPGGWLAVFAAAWLQGGCQPEDPAQNTPDQRVDDEPIDWPGTPKLVADTGTVPIHTFDGTPPELDGDGDGFTVSQGDCDDADPTRNPADVDGDGLSTCAGDCDDSLAAVYPGAPESCDGTDEDCDGTVDNGFDADFDTFSPCLDDCDDGNPFVNPSVVEGCDGIDNNCDSVVDEGFDADGDGFGACLGDCDDTSALAYPGAPELCDGADNDCNAAVDDSIDFVTWYLDADGDGIGDASNSTTICEPPPPGWVVTSGDCDDAVAGVFPGATELCNGIDDDCSGAADDGLVFTTYYLDEDGDGFGVDATATVTCDGPPANYVAASGDCDDAAPGTHVGAAELCNGVDDDCSGVADDGLEFVSYFADGDGDGFGLDGTEVSTCDGAPAGHAAAPGDCDDAVASVFPGATETCNAIDDDCSGAADDGLEFVSYYADLDLDGYGDAATQVSTCDGAPEGHIAASGDCDDAVASVFPGATEVCDGVDQDCSGAADDGLEFVTYYFDGDLDGFGLSDVKVATCDGAPGGYVTADGDCDDTALAVFPGASELCDALDNDCDGLVPDTEIDDDLDGMADCTGDCNDADATTYFGATELCDGVDNNCNGAVPLNEQDGDADGFRRCAGDCNDAAAAVYPGATEVCDGVDNDCNGDTDTADAGYAADFDGDGDLAADCGGTDCDDADPAMVGTDLDGDGYSTCTGDCDDGVADFNPGATETCDGADNDCDGLTDQDDDGAVLDVDGDGYDDEACGGSDCDDSRSNVFPSSLNETSSYVKACAPLLSPDLDAAVDAWNDQRVEQPSIVFDGSEYKMYYRGEVNANYMSFGLATSQDGVTWTEYEDNPVYTPWVDAAAWDKNSASSPWAVYDANDVAAPYKIYYHAKLVSGKRVIGLITSTDGIAWTPYGTGPIVSNTAGWYDSDNAHNPTVLIDSLTGEYQMWYSGKQGSTYSIIYAWSTDGGYTWTKYEATPVFFAGGAGEWDSVRIASPAVIQEDDGGYRFWYAGAPDTSFLSIGSGTSIDPYSFVRGGLDPVLSPDADQAARFDSSELNSVFPMVHEGGITLVYSGSIGHNNAVTYISTATNWYPVVEIDSPADGADVAGSFDVAGIVTDSHADGIVLTVFDETDSVVGSGTPLADGSFSITVVDLDPGAHDLTVVAEDAGYLTGEMTVSVTMN
ncbi:hypothetical protein L6R50_04135 [Myxococcota bacterium]|nr:hypothetical protein [Myxococcota bacterium]